MTPRQFYQKHSKEHITAVSEAAGTKYSNFQQIAVAKGSVGKDLAARLAKESGGEMTVLEILFPDEYGEEHTAA